MYEIDYAVVGAKIRQRRKELNISQERLAEMCEVSSSYIGHIERGTRKLSMPVALRLCEALKTGLDYLFIDFACTDNEILQSVQSALLTATTEQKKKFISSVKILADNINKM